MSNLPNLDQTDDPTVDIALLARVNRGDRVEVRGARDQTLELFAKTLALVRDELDDRADGQGSEPGRATPITETRRGFVPENPDLRSIYFLAEAVGGYEALNDLVNAHSPGNTLSERMSRRAQVDSLSEDDVSQLREYQAQIHKSLGSAHAYLRDRAAHELDRQQLAALHDVILNASDRSTQLTRILGDHLVHEVERIVARLHEIQTMSKQVDRSVDGIFLVNSEVMFIPSEELIRLVNILFEAVGNAHFARQADGVMLLAARNLLIEVCAFYAYYGKHQIYNLLSKAGSNVSVNTVTARIRGEIRKLFLACQADNKLVLTRVMQDAQREFELSVEAIQAEAAESAVEAVKAFIPGPAVAKPAKKGLFRRLLGWLSPASRRMPE